jgi:hypothetical protein
MEATVTFETSLNFYQTTRHNNPEDSYPHTRRRQNLNLTFTVFILIAIILLPPPPFPIKYHWFYSAIYMLFDTAIFLYLLGLRH